MVPDIMGCSYPYWIGDIYELEKQGGKLMFNFKEWHNTIVYRLSSKDSEDMLKHALKTNKAQKILLKKWEKVAEEKGLITYDIVFSNSSSYGYKHREQILKTYVTIQVKCSEIR